MAATWYVLRRTLRRRWASYLVMAMLLAVGGGAALAAVAGARRTVSAYPRYLQASNGSDVSIDAQGLMTGAVRRRVARLPGVVRAASYRAFNAAPVGPDGAVDVSYSAEGIGSIDGRFFGQDRVVIVEGRAADPDRAGELVVNQVSAQRYRYKVGQHLRFAIVSDPHLNENFEHPVVDAYQRVRIVGIAKFNDEIVQDEIESAPTVLFTPAFSKAHLKLGTYVWTGLQVEGGRRGVTQVLSGAGRVGVKQPFVRLTSDVTNRAQRAVRPLAWSLALFGLAAGAAVIVLAGQAIARQVRVGADDHPVLRAMGMRPSGIAAVGLAAGVATAAAGAVGAAIVAVALSPLTPVGPVRVAEPSPGVAVDVWVLVAGVALLFLLVLAQPAVAAWRLQRMRGGETHSVRPSRLVGAVARSGAPLTLLAGARFALEPGRGRTSVPVRSTLVSALVALVALSGALTWGASLHALVSQPRLYGWNWDATLFLEGGYGDAHAPLAKFRPLLDHDPAVQDWAGMTFESVQLGGRSVVTVGLDRGKGAITLPLVGEGTAPGVRGVLLGAQTMKALHKHVGDHVTLTGGKAGRSLEITGQAVFPTLGAVHSDRVSLASGALVDREVLDGATGGQGRGVGAIAVRFRPGADAAAAVQRIRAYADHHPELIIDAVFSGPKRPADIVNFREMGLAPTLMAALFGVVALGALANALVMSVHRRRRDLALLKALGVTRRQVSFAVAWQATITMVIALVIGVPIGVAIGRTLWIAFANSLGVVPRPTVPLATLALVAAAVLIIANLIAALPGRAGSRTDAGVVLRTE